MAGSWDTSLRAKRVREVANLTEKKICIPLYMVSKNLSVCLSGCLSVTINSPTQFACRGIIHLLTSLLPWQCSWHFFYHLAPCYLNSDKVFYFWAINTVIPSRDSNLGPKPLSLLEFKTWRLKPLGHHGRFSWHLFAQIFCQNYLYF